MFAVVSNVRERMAGFPSNSQPVRLLPANAAFLRNEAQP